MRHRLAHDDRGSALQASHAPRGVAAHRQPSGAGKGVVHPAVSHPRPLRRVTREQISACLKRDEIGEPSSSLRGATATKQSSFLVATKLDCFASLAMTNETPAIT